MTFIFWLSLKLSHLDNTSDDTVVSSSWYSDTAIHGYNIYRKDRNANRGGRAVYIKNHIPVKLRGDLMLKTFEVKWLQVHLPHLKPILVGSCYRPPSANSQYLDNMSEMLDNVCDLNIDWLSSSCPLKTCINHIFTAADMCFIAVYKSIRWKKKLLKLETYFPHYL